MKKLTALVAVIATLAGSTPSAAAPSAKEAKASYESALSLFRAKKYDEAHAQLLVAAAIEPRPAVTWMLGQTALRAGRPLEAVHHFDAWIRDVPHAPSALKAKVASARKEASEQLGQIDVSTYDGATVTVDDGEPLAAPVREPVMVDPGRHRVRITRGDESETRIIEVAAGERVEVRGGPNAPVTATRALPREPAATSGAPPSETASRTTWPIWLGGVVAVSGLSTAIVFGSLRVNAEHAAEVSRAAIVRSGSGLDRCGAPPPELASACATQAREGAAADAHMTLFAVGLGVGLAGAALAVGYYVFGAKGAPEGPAKTRVVPVVGARTGGAAIVGSF